MLKHSVYITHAQALSPDIVVGLADLPSGTTASTRRMQNMTARTEDWMQQMATANNDGHCLNLFASILPVELEAQRLYLEMLQNELSDSIDGLAFYSSASAAVIPAGLAHLPRLSMSSLMTPQQILREVMLGVDLFAVEFVNASTDAGVALKFEFPAPTDTYTRTTEHSHLHRKEMGIDVWSDEHATDLSPLTADCDCYTCEKHHRAYIHHLLVAKEMLAWTLLQVHNYTMINRFFTGIRRSIKKGEFERDVGLFEDIYEAAMPKGGGKGPRYVHTLGPRVLERYHVLKHLASQDSRLSTRILRPQRGKSESRGLQVTEDCSCSRPIVALEIQCNTRFSVA